MRPPCVSYSLCIHDYEFMIMNFNVEPSFISNVCIGPGMYLYNYDVNSFFQEGWI